MSDAERGSLWTALSRLLPGSGPRAGSGIPSRLRSFLATPWPDLVGVGLSYRAARVVRVGRRGSPGIRLSRLVGALPPGAPNTSHPPAALLPPAPGLGPHPGLR